VGVIVVALWDAIEMVDWRSGEIRNREINAWLWNETLAGLRQIDHPRVLKLVDRLADQKDELLTFLDGLALELETWQARLVHHFIPAFPSGIVAGSCRWFIPQIAGGYLSFGFDHL
jgi:hypothetical protein